MSTIGHNQPHSERYRIAAKEWVERESAASLLEETKSAVLSQMKNRCPEKTEAAKERAVKASEEWNEFVTGMVKAREAANLAKVKLKYMEMKYFEAQSADATARAERRM